MSSYVYIGLSVLSISMIIIGVFQVCSHQDKHTPNFLSSEPSARSLMIAEHNVRMLRAVGDQIVGAILIAGGFVSGCILWS
ncbi:MAG: hypothetical protein AB7E60_11665 [Sphingobium sp.]